MRKVKTRSRNIEMKYLLLIGAFLSSICGFSQEGELIDKVIGVVGSEIVLKSDLEFQALSRSGGKEVSEEQKCEEFEDLLLQKLLYNQAKLDSIEISEPELQSEIEARLAHFVSMFGSIEAFEEYYGKSVAQWKVEFADPMEEQLMVQKMQGQMLSTVTVTPGEVQEFFTSIPADSLPLMPAEVEYSQIMMAPTIDEEEKTRTRDFLDSVRVRIMDGKSLMSLEAIKWSEDPGSKSKGGCYPLQQRGSFVPEYEAAVDQTPEDGYSPIFETTYGFHFVYVKEKRGEYYEACHILMTPQVDEADLEKSRIKLDSIANLIANDSIGFKSAALSFSTDENTRNQEGRVINPQTGGAKHSVNDMNPDVFFVVDKLDEGEVSTPVLVDTPEGGKAWMIIHLDKRTDAHVANLKQDYLIFKQQAENVKKFNELGEWITKKLKKTYVRVNEEYSACEFKYKWFEAGKDASAQSD
jgi:peptidyl-prolyl cis-trans isomerase SurA